MKYSHKYTKLNKDRYTTIRRYPKGKKGEYTMEIYPGGSHRSLITSVFRSTLDDLPSDFLKDDTDCKTKKKAIKLIQSFYKKPIDIKNEKFYIYRLKRDDFK